MSDENDKIEKHESYGLLSISRATTTPARNLFGSSIKHTHLICLRIARGSKRRSLNQDWYHEEDYLLEAEMSATQFADAITSLNTGPGVPITLTFVEGKGVEHCPEVNVRREIQEEFKAKCEEMSKELVVLQEQIDTILDKKSILVKDREELRSAVDTLICQIANNMPFIHSQFNEAMDKTSTEAKGEIEEFFNHAIHRFGLEKLKERLSELVLPEAGGVKQIMG